MAHTGGMTTPRYTITNIRTGETRPVAGTFAALTEAGVPINVQGSLAYGVPATRWTAWVGEGWEATPCLFRIARA